MNPVMIHADGTDCHHDGEPQATVHDEGGPVCPAGQQVTHIRFGERTLTIDEAYSSLQSIARVFTAGLTPIVTELAAAFRRIGSDPAVRALAAACQVVDEERRSASLDTQAP